MALFQQGSFIFDANTSSPQELARKRAIVAQLMGQRSAPRNVGEGLVAIGDGIVANVLNRRANETEQAGQASASEAFNPLLDAFNNRLTGGFPEAPTSGTSAPAPSSAEAIGGRPGFSGSQQEFVDMLLPAAMEASERTGIDPRIIVAQAAQETGWGRSAPGNNFFGIKSHGQGGGQALRTHEYVNGRRVNVTDRFRTFDSPSDSVQGYADFILNNPRYKPLMAAQGLDAQLEALQASGYATDPNYSRSVGAIARGIQVPTAAAPSTGVQAVDAFADSEMPTPTGPLPLLDDVFDERFGSAPVNPPAPMDVNGIPAGGNAFAQPAPPLSAPQTVQDRPVQVAQAGGGFPEMAGQNPQAIPAPSGPDLQMLLRAASNPWLNENQRAVVNTLLEQQLQAQDPYRQAQIAQMQAQTERLQRQAQGGDTRFGLNPIYGQDAEGNTVLGVLGDDGSFKPVDTGGVNISTGVDRVDLGTHYGLLDKRSGQMVGTLPKENYQEAFDTASGTNDAKSAAEARANLPKVEDNAYSILGMIDSLDKDPYLDSMLGPVSSRLPNVTADAARVQSKMDQIGGQAFLQAFESLKGGGTITEIEGQKATESIARLNTAQNPQDYRDALNELRSIVQRGVERARRSAGMGGGTQAPPGADGWQDMGGVRIRRKQ